MIINKNREPKFSLFYIGAIILKHMRKNYSYSIDKLYAHLNEDYRNELGVEYFYLGIDWLYILGKVTLNNGELKLCE